MNLNKTKMVLFKRIRNFDKHWIDMDGNIWSDNKNDFLKPILGKRGYYYVSLCQNGKVMKKTLHRLIAEAYIENNNNYPIVDHVDMNPLNNKITNLRWTTVQGNGQNKITNREEINICNRTDGKGYNVNFNFKEFKINKFFTDLEKAREFRTIIQERIHSNEAICPIFVELYKNEMKNIFRLSCGRYRLLLKRPNLKFYGKFETLEEAKAKRYELLKEFYGLK